MTCVPGDHEIEVSWDKVLINCEAQPYTLSYTGNISWKDEVINITAINTMETGFTLPSDQYVPATDYVFEISTSLRSGNCLVSTQAERKNVLLFI